MQQNRKPLTVIDGETLMDTRLPKRSFCIETLLPEGISMLGGAPKIGKSWMVLDFGVRIAKGESIWNLPTKPGTVLYLALEDSLARIQDRLCKITDEVPNNLFIATMAGTLADNLCSQIENFVLEHSDTLLVIIDTFQLIRTTTDISYANDYDEVRKLKTLADKLHISLLLVHHLRKQGDSDPLNKLSGTTGISGAMDAIFILDVSKRHARGATLFCTGRDIESREIELNMSRKTCAWELISDTLDKPDLTLPNEILKLVEFTKSIEQFKGGNTEFAERFCVFSGVEISAKALKQLMNRWRYQLEEKCVYFKSSRSNGQRFLEIRYIPPSVVNDNEQTMPSGDDKETITNDGRFLAVGTADRDESAVQDGTSTVCDFSVPSVPCVPVECEENE